MGLPEISLEVAIGEAGLPVMLDPFEAARGEIRRGPEAPPFLQELEGEIARLEGDVRFLALVPAADREDLAAHLPHMRAAPLNDVRGGRKRTAEAIEFSVGHRQCEDRRRQ